MGIPVRRAMKGTEIGEGDGVYFYSLRPWGSYPFIARTVIRGLYKFYRWNTHDGSFESQGFYTTFRTVEEARVFAKARGWGFQIMPINKPLPSETCQYSVCDVPASDAHYVTVNRDLPIVAVHRSMLETLFEGLTKLLGRPKAAP